jgi:hypothetical protein
MAIRPDNMHLDFRGGIATQDGTILHKDRAQTVPCRR